MAVFSLKIAPKHDTKNRYPSISTITAEMGGFVPQLRDRQAFLKRIGGRRTDPAGAPGRGRTEPHLHAAPQKGGLP